MMILTNVVILVVPLALARSQDGNAKNRTCFRGWTGPDSGGSCSFKNILCDWTNIKEDETDWELTDKGLFLNNLGKNQNDRALLVGPDMCEEEGTDLCFTLRYQFDGTLGSGFGAELSFRVCDANSCGTSPPIWAARDQKDEKWMVKEIPFKSPGQFKMQVEGKKHTDRFILREANVYIAYLVYKNTSCDPVQQQTTTKKNMDTTTQATVQSSTGISTASAVTDGSTQPFKQTEEEEEKEEKEEEEGEEDGHPGFLIAVVFTVPIILIAVAIVTAVCVIKRRRSKARESKVPAAEYNRNDSLLMVTNELYAATGFHDDHTDSDRLGVIREIPETQQDPALAASDPENVYYSTVDKQKNPRNTKPVSNNPNGNGPKGAESEERMKNVTYSRAKETTNTPNHQMPENEYENSVLNPRQKTGESQSCNVPSECGRATERDNQGSDTYNHLNDPSLKVNP